jgi:hypothetical protein
MHAKVLCILTLLLILNGVITNSIPAI